MAEISRLIIKVESDGVAKATTRLDALTDQSSLADRAAAMFTGSIGKTGTALAKTGAKAKVLTGSFTALTDSSALSDRILKQVRKSLGGAGTAAEKMGGQMGGAAKQTAPLAPALEKAGVKAKVLKGNFKAMKGSTSQLSYQLQDIAVQAQMGTNAFTILGQQGPQIASIFGPGGAVFGVLIALGAMVGGTLYQAFKAGAGGAKEMQEALSRLEGQVVRNSDGVVEFSRKLEELARISNAAVAAELALRLGDAEVAAKGATKGVVDLGAGLTGLTGQAFLDGFDASGFGENIAAIEKSGVTQAKLLDEQATFLERKKAALNMDVGSVEEATAKATRLVLNDIDAISEKLGISAKEALRLGTALAAFEKGGPAADLGLVIDQITASTGAANVHMSEYARGTKAHLDTLRKVEETEKLIKKHRLAAARGDLPPMAGDADEATANAEKLVKLRAKIRAQGQEDIAAGLKVADANTAQATREAAAEARKYEAQKVSAERFLDQVTMLGLTEEQAFAERQSRITDRLKQELAARTLSQDAYQTGIDALAREAEARDLNMRSGYLLSWQEQTREAMTDMDLMGANMANNLSLGMGDAFNSILTGTASAKDAFTDLARGMAASMVSALADMAAQWVALQLVKKVTGKAEETSAAAARSLSAAASVAQSALHAYASAAAVPVVGYLNAPAAAAAAIAATTPMAASVTALSASAAAARALGGQVRGGESYLVGERGPELLHMGTSGRVVPNDNIGAGGGVSIVNNVDASGGGADVDIRIQQAMIQTNRQTVAQIQDLLRRGRLIT